VRGNSSAKSLVMAARKSGDLGYDSSPTRAQVA